MQRTVCCMCVDTCTRTHSPVRWAGRHVEANHKQGLRAPAKQGLGVCVCRQALGGRNFLQRPPAVIPSAVPALQLRACTVVAASCPPCSSVPPLQPACAACSHGPAAPLHNWASHQQGSRGTPQPATPRQHMHQTGYRPCRSQAPRVASTPPANSKQYAAAEAAER